MELVKGRWKLQSGLAVLGPILWLNETSYLRVDANMSDRLIAHTKCVYLLGMPKLTLTFQTNFMFTAAKEMIDNLTYPFHSHVLQTYIVFFIKCKVKLRCFVECLACFLFNKLHFNVQNIKNTIKVPYYVFLKMNFHAVCNTALSEWKHPAKF